MTVGRDRRFHDLMNYAGIKALPTAASLLQLCKELRRLGFLDEEGMQRVKEAMEYELELSLPQTHIKTDLENSLRKHMDVLFSWPEEKE